jgi:hypothetical protein
MDGGAQDSVMAEIALALAMGFFSVMVLTMVSMGAGEAEILPAASPDRVALAASDGGTKGGAAAPVAAGSVLIFYRGRFFDAALKPIDPSRFDAGSGQVLAVEPGLPLEEALAARRRIAGRDLTVTTLDARWLERLKSVTP